MSEVLLPTWIIPEEETQEPLDEGSSVFRAAFAPGIAQRQSYGGLRLKMSRRHTVRAEEKAQLLSILKATRGRFNALRTKVHFALRGSFPSSEVLINNTFANGTTGWTPGSETSLSVSDRILRLSRSAVTSTQDALAPSSAGTVVQYAPYVARAFLMQGRGSYSTFKATIGSTSGANDYANAAALSTYGLHSAAGVALSTSAYFGVEELASSGLVAGDYFSTPYVSMARCAQVDNGVNQFTRSDELDHTDWTKTNVTVSANTGALVAPDGVANADRVFETTANAVHTISESKAKTASAQDWCIAGAFHIGLGSNPRSHVYLQLDDNAGNLARCIFNVSVGSAGSTTTAGTFASARAFISPLGNGWYYCALVARTNAAATIVGSAGISSNGTLISYTGDTNSDIVGWRLTLAQAGSPVRLAATTSAALTTGTSQSGGALHVRGLPASSNGLLLPGDWFEFNGEIKQVSLPLNSDAAGLGYLQFEPPLVRAPADGDAVNITDPMGKFLVSNIKIENEFGTQAIVTYDLEHIYE